LRGGSISLDAFAWLRGLRPGALSAPTLVIR